MSERKFGGTIVKIGSEVVGKITSFSRSVEVGETDVTGSEDLTAPGSGVLKLQYVPATIGETASLEGIALSSNQGQSDLKDAAETGTIVTISQEGPDGYGYELEGFFTSYQENGSLSEGIYTWSGEFRVNVKTDITPEP